MRPHPVRKARWTLASWRAVFLMLAAFGLPRVAHGAVCNGAFDILQKGFCSTTTNQGCLSSADCPAGETCKTFDFLDPGNPKGNGGNQLRVNLAIGAGSITTGTPPQLTVNRIRFDLDCVANSGFPCTDQGNVVQYGGDATITTTCAGVTWTSSTAQGGNEIVFAASQPIVIAQNCSPRGTVACGNCTLEFAIRVQSQEPSGSDATPQVVEEVAGYRNGAGDATCSATLQSGASQTSNLPICPTCTVDQCNLGCDQTTGTCTPKSVSTPCTDTDGNECTLAGCEVSPTTPGLGVCVQTHMFASDSTPCADTDGISCTTAGCDGNGVCDQQHMAECCNLTVEKTACVAPAAPPAPGCTGGAIALTLQYTGPTISGATTVVVTGSNGATTTYNLPSLTDGDVLTKASENGFTIDATAHGQSKLGSKTTVTINGTAEVLHTSCSCRATPETNLALCNPMCLDSSSPDNTTGTKGPPSPLWTLVGLKDPTLGTETCDGTTGDGGDCHADLPAGGGDVEYTYKITNNAPTAVSNVTVEDDKFGTVPGSPIASIPAGGSATLTAKQFVAATTVNTVMVNTAEGCMAQASAAVVAPCALGYPFTSQNPRTSVAFNESEVLRAFQPAAVRPHERLMVFYNDEHALTLGVKKVLVKTSSGTTMMTFPFTLLPSSPSGTTNPDVGTTDLDGDKAGTDTNTCAGHPDLCDRPLFPALFITDITDDPSSKAGDWQSGIIDPQTGGPTPEAIPIPPDAVFGTWKGAVRTVDKTKNPPFITVTTDADPAKNNYNLDGGDPAPSGLTNQGYGAEIVWDVDALLAAGLIQENHVYRVQFMVHDGDQNKVGGDTGQGCATVFVK